MVISSTLTLGWAKNNINERGCRKKQVEQSSDYRCVLLRTYTSICTCICTNTCTSTPNCCLISHTFMLHTFLYHITLLKIGQIRDFNSCVTDRRTDGRTDRRTDGPTDRRKDTPSYRDARTHLPM